MHYGVIGFKTLGELAETLNNSDYMKVITTKKNEALIEYDYSSLEERLRIDEGTVLVVQIGNDTYHYVSYKNGNLLWNRGAGVGKEVIVHITDSTYHILERH